MILALSRRPDQVDAAVVALRPATLTPQSDP